MVWRDLHKGGALSVGKTNRGASTPDFIEFHTKMVSVHD